MSGKETTKELLEELLKQQKLKSKNDMQFSANLSILMNKQEDFSNKQNAFNQKISGLLFTDNDTNRDGYIANQDDLNLRVTNLETKNKITAGKIGISVVILSAIGSFFFWITSITWK